MVERFLISACSAGGDRGVVADSGWLWSVSKMFGSIE